MNMLTGKMSHIYHEKLPLPATQLYSHRKRNVYYTIRISLLYYKIRNGINLKDKENAVIEKQYPQFNQ